MTSRVLRKFAASSVFSNTISMVTRTDSKGCTSLKTPSPCRIIIRPYPTVGHDFRPHSARVANCLSVCIQAVVILQESVDQVLLPNRRFSTKVKQMKMTNTLQWSPTMIERFTLGMANSLPAAKRTTWRRKTGKVSLVLGIVTEPVLSSGHRRSRE